MKGNHTQGEWSITTGMYSGSYHLNQQKNPLRKSENEANVKLIEASPKMLKELIRLNSDKPRHPNHPKSTFKSKSEYDQAYKKWSRTDKVIKKAIA